MQWHALARKITTNLKVQIEFILPKLSMTKIVTWIFHVYDCANSRCDVILGRDLLTSLGLNINYTITSLKQIMDLLKVLRHT